MAAVRVDEFDRLVEAGDHLDGQHQIQVLGIPVGVAARRGLDERAGGGVAAQLHAGSAQLGRRRRQEAWRDGRVHQQRLDRVAHRRILRLGVAGDARGHRHVGAGVDVHVADAVGVTHHRDARGILDGAHQLVAAARDDQVDQVVEGEQGLDFGARLGQVQGIGQRRILAQRRIDGGEQRRIGVARLRAALEDGGIARFQAQGGDLHQRVRARLEYDAQDPDRHRDPGQHEVVVEAPPPLDLADRIGQLDQLPYPLHYARELLLQAQPLDQRRRHTGAAGVLQVR